jgi:hypothetical protein
MRPGRIAIALVALGLAACATTLPPVVRVTDLTTLAGTYSGRLKEVSQLSRSTRLVVQPNGNFELTASEPRGFRTLGVMALEPDGTFKYLYDESKGEGKVLSGRGVVHEGDGRRVLVMTHDDGLQTMTVSRSLP